MAVPPLARTAIVALLVAIATLSSTSPCPRGKVLCPGLTDTSSSPSPDDCILPRDFCDGIPDCSGIPGTTADESNCTACSAGAFMCRKDSRCIRREWLCDDTQDCSDGEDEKDCPTNKTVSWHGKELRRYSDVDKDHDNKVRWDVVMCDGVQDARSAEDESSDKCTPYPGRDAFWRFSVCHSGAVKCSRPGRFKDYKCVPAKRVCDGYDDCLNGEDERNCTTTTTAPTTTSTTTMAPTTTSTTSMAPTTTSTTTMAPTMTSPTTMAPTTQSTKTSKAMESSSAAKPISKSTSPSATSTVLPECGQGCGDPTSKTGWTVILVYAVAGILAVLLLMAFVYIMILVVSRRVSQGSFSVSHIVHFHRDG